MFNITILIFKFVRVVFVAVGNAINRKIASTIHRYRYNLVDPPKNIVIIGASFAGYHAAKLLANSVPTGYQIVVIEKSSHFQFTWVFPRFSVVNGHEHKAFIPYGPFLKGAPKGSWRMIQDTVLEVSPRTISLQSGVKLDYEFLVLATGSQASSPSRLNVNEKNEGIKVLQSLQNQIRKASDMVIVGGGPAGVELATDVKSVNPHKNVTLIHSRKTLLSNFGTKVHDVALEALEGFGVCVILGERVQTHSEDNGSVVLGTGAEIPCDLLVRCTGQKAASDIIAELCPDAVSSSGGFVKVKSTLQIADDRFSNIYAAGDIVASTGPKNGRSAARQAEIVSNNVVRAIKGQSLTMYHSDMLIEGGIELTLGLDEHVVYLTDGLRDMLLTFKSKDIALKSEACWKMMGSGPRSRASPPRRNQFPPPRRVGQSSCQPCVSLRGGRPHTNSELLKELVDRTPRREPMLRFGIPMAGIALEFQLGSNIKRVEAMYIFMVGRIADAECDSRGRDRGIFPFCVTVDLADGHVRCANCHWDNYICSKAQVESSRTTSRYSGQGSRGLSNEGRAKISEDILELGAAFNLLKQDNERIQERVASNSTAWTTLNTTTSTLVAQQGRILRQRDT
ncbi:FAD-dependent pyridine nucleotide-disulfide oxidoreductase [Penicillium expansum]|uniref:FAD-dependent pyridine nucleotide-disulfide oxidoreductase n=1 Tax=Penicillium expansum TaxID=27334 RepID=A0A0A2JZT0_PENEN|nr:FAD-dependent pyridine nucleotide-disulfide oxidoreductase [Penicillium expansum]KGO60944.1 FAD-dependent pyridine nucleotide-disulfide oxidoreductase [Penicillium expansum]